MGKKLSSIHQIHLPIVRRTGVAIMALLMVRTASQGKGLRVARGTGVSHSPAMAICAGHVQ